MEAVKGAIFSTMSRGRVTPLQALLGHLSRCGCVWDELLEGIILGERGLLRAQPIFRPGKPGYAGLGVQMATESLTISWVTLVNGNEWPVTSVVWCC